MKQGVGIVSRIVRLMRRLKGRDKNIPIEDFEEIASAVEAIHTMVGQSQPAAGALSGPRTAKSIELLSIIQPGLESVLYCDPYIHPLIVSFWVN